MRYTLLMHYTEMSADELGPEALAEGMRAFDPWPPLDRQHTALWDRELIAIAPTRGATEAHAALEARQTGTAE